MLRFTDWAKGFPFSKVSIPVLVTLLRVVRTCTPSLVSIAEVQNAYSKTREINF